MDISVFSKGYHGDLNETFVVGKVDEESKKLIKAAHEVINTLPFSLGYGVATYIRWARSVSSM